MMACVIPAGIRGVLLDIDGTLLLHDRPLPGATALPPRLAERGLPFRLLTNTTRRSRRATAQALCAAGVMVADDAVLTPAVLARRRILESGRLRCGLLVPAEAQADLAGVVEDRDAPEWVVVADLGAGFTWDALNAAFRWIRGGATLLALHRNPWWDAGNGPVLDAGAFVAALEYATGRTAEVVGKPSAAFFQLALADLGLPASEVLVVGDDPEADVAGGAAAGCRTALVLTGGMEGQDPARLGVQPDFVLRSIADLG